jgi:hypothetical protein
MVGNSQKIGAPPVFSTAQTQLYMHNSKNFLGLKHTEEAMHLLV